MPLHVRFVAEKVALGQFLIRALRLHLSVILPQFSILIFNDLLFVPVGRAGEAWERPSKTVVSQIPWIVEQKGAFTLLPPGRVKDITRYTVIRLKECRIFAPYLLKIAQPLLQDVTNLRMPPRITCSNSLFVTEVSFHWMCV